MCVRCFMQTTESVVTIANIPIIISSPDDCVTGSKSEESAELQLPVPAQRRSSCPFTLYRANTEDKSSPSSPGLGLRRLRPSRKRRHDTDPLSSESDAGQRRTSLQSVIGDDQTPASITSTAAANCTQKQQQQTQHPRHN